MPREDDAGSLAGTKARKEIGLCRACLGDKPNVKAETFKILTDEFD